MNTFGFTVVIGKNAYKSNFGASSIIDREIISVYNHMVIKFEQDKIFEEDDDFIVVLDGVILNKINLDKRHDWYQTIISLYIEKGDTFFNDFRGSFSGILHDKKKRRTIIFSDHIGTKFLYYSLLDNGTIICSSMIRYVYDYFKMNHITYSLSIESAYLLLTYGYMLGNRTLCNKIFKITPGCYLVIENGKIEEKRYCLLSNEPDYSLSERDAIDLYDSEFRRAVKLQFEKDREYNYRHLVALSGGLDSRMTTWVAHELGYTEQLNYTFSQSDYWDEIVPKQIARDIKHEWIFKALDNGLWLYDIDEITNLTGGNVLYYGLAHNNSLLKNLDISRYGIIHSGQLGDVVMGTFYDAPNPNLKFSIGDGAYSKKYVNKTNNVILEEYDNQEISKFYHRGFSGTNNGQLVDMLYSETYSPFMDWDLMNNILTVPVKYRFNHQLYKKWILSKYPKAAKYVWEKMQASVKMPIFAIFNKEIPIQQIPNRIMWKLHLKKSGIDSSKHMNPIGYYLSANIDLRKSLMENFDKLDLVPDNALKSILIGIASGENSMEKIQAISLLNAIGRFFKN